MENYIYILNEYLKKEITVYHNFYGSGIVKNISEDLRYIDIDFREKRLSTFLFPDSLGRDIYLNKTTEILNREKKLLSKEYDKIDQEEQAYFLEVTNYIETQLEAARNADYEVKATFNDFSDSFDSKAYGNRQKTMIEVALLNEVKRKPYFARLDYDACSKYIGKNAVDKYVIDWRAKECILYYKSDLYINNSEFNIKLIRDFEIVAGRYFGFNDKYNKFSNNINEEISTIISDDFLLRIIKENRKDNQISDIIQSIQKNQYDIITCEKDKNVLVQGCAGSGKTMILLHRLSYLFFHDDQVDSTYYSISPSKILNLEGDELAKDLGLNSVKRYTSIEFYIDLLRKYNKKYKIDDQLNNLDYKSNNLLPNEFVEYIYDDEFYDMCKEDFKGIEERRGQVYEQILQLEYDRISNSLEELQPQVPFEYDITQKIREIDKIISTLPAINAQALLENKSNGERRNSEYKKKILRVLLDKWDTNSVPVLSQTKRELIISDELFTQYVAIFDGMAKGASNWQLIAGHKDIIEKYTDSITYITKYRILLHQYEALNNYVSGKNSDHYSYLRDAYIYLLKEESGIAHTESYEFELFIKLISCYSTYGGIDEKGYIFIDEFQDYSISEILLFERVCKNGVFNLYGDVNQNISIKGITGNRINLLKVQGWEKYEINENYRNAYEITTFINDEFNMSMVPIGLEGKVDLVEEKNLTMGHMGFAVRTALIYKDPTAVQKYIDLDIHYNIISDDNMVVSADRINIIPIWLAKGLEFEKVIVLTQDMTFNEMYVAYTRSLTELIVIRG